MYSSHDKGRQAENQKAEEPSHTDRDRIVKQTPRVSKEGTRKILENDKPAAKCTTERMDKDKSHFSVKNQYIWQPLLWGGLRKREQITNIRY